jgi:hypothetical protein
MELPLRRVGQSNYKRLLLEKLYWARVRSDELQLRDHTAWGEPSIPIGISYAQLPLDLCVR